MTCFNVNGVTLRKYCIENGIKYSRVYSWLEKGYSIQESIENAKNIKSNLKWVKNGKSVLKICKESKIFYNSVLRAIKKGCSIDEAIEKSKRLRYIHGRPVKYEYNGQRLRKYCIDNGISYSTLYYWLKKGLSVEKAIRRVKNV